MDIHEIIRSQYRAALEMHRQAVVRCPDSMWQDETNKNRFWHVAYHALFYIHLYLQPAEADFTAWQGHQPESQFMGPVPWSPHNLPQIARPYSREDVLAYHQVCLEQVESLVPNLDLHAPSGFSWLPFSKLELQFYNIRHLQQHTGELCERLGTAAGVDVDWVGSKSA
jgi:hypothetical protein